MIRWQVGYSCFCAGRLQEALDVLAEVADRSDGDSSPNIMGFSPWIMSLMISSRAAAWRGDLDRARALDERTIELAREGNRAEELGWGLATGADIALFDGEHRNARAPDLDRAVLEALEIANRLGSHFSRTTTLDNLGQAHLVAGRWTEAIRAFEEALDLMRREGTFTEDESLILAYLARAHLEAGDTSRARALVDDAIKVAACAERPHQEAFAHLTGARIDLTTDGATGRERIEASLARGRELVEQTGAHGLSPQIREVEARLAMRSGDHEASGRTLREALALYEEIHALGHAARLRAELGV